MVGAGRFERPTPCAQASFQYPAEVACFQALLIQADGVETRCNWWSRAEPRGFQQLHSYLQRFRPYAGVPVSPSSRSRTRFDVPQALAISLLSENHRQVLIPIRKPPPLRTVVVTSHSRSEE